MSVTRFFANCYEDSSVGQIKFPRDKILDFIKSIIRTIEIKFRPTRKNGEDGIYLGTAGVAYMYYQMSKNPKVFTDTIRNLTMSLEYLKPALTAPNLSTKKKEAPSFILGNCGVYAIAAAIYKAIGDSSQFTHYRNLYTEAANTCKDIKFLTNGSDELFVGRAGYVMGALWLAHETGSKLKLIDLYDICKVMIQSGRKYTLKGSYQCPLMYSYYNVEYLGAAHGLCSILQAIMSVPGYLDNNPEDAKHVKGSVDYLLTLQDHEGNFPSSIDEIGSSSVLIHWCHGAGGMIYLMAKAYLVWDDIKYLDSCKKMTKLIWHKGLLKKGPGICHGVAGNGYSFLLMYRLTGEEDYLHKAEAFASFMKTDTFTKGSRTPDCPYSLFEGTAGTACFLADLLEPQSAAFPFSDVFCDFTKNV